MDKSISCGHEKDELISRRVAIEAADKIIKRDTSGNNDVVKAMTAWKEYIAGLTAVDAVPVVRCRDCVHNELPPTAGNALCSIYDGMTEVYGFCHNGERREE